MPLHMLSFQPRRRPAAAGSGGAVPLYDSKSGRIATNTGWSDGGDVTLPAGYGNKFGLLTMIVQGNAGSVTTDLSAQGWTYLGKSSISTSQTRRVMHMWWKRLGATEPGDKVTVYNTVTTAMAQATVFTGLRATDTPVALLNSGDTTGTNPSTLLGSTTTRNNSLVLAMAAYAEASSSGQLTGWTNAALSDVTEITDESATTGNQAGYAIATGGKAVAGAFGNTTVTGANTLTKTFAHIELYS